MEWSKGLVRRNIARSTVDAGLDTNLTVRLFSQAVCDGRKEEPIQTRISLGVDEDFSGATQCAAVRIHTGVMRVPPHWNCTSAKLM